MGVQVDPVGQGSPLSMQVERGGGILEAVANASDESISKPKDCILATEKVQEMSNRLDVDDILRTKKQGIQSQRYTCSILGIYFGECNVSKQHSRLIDLRPNHRYGP